MNILKTSVLVVVVVASLHAVADAPVAVRVEVEPLRAEGEDTRVALTVQVSPEDRSRIGKNAMLRIELDGGPPPGQSPLWAVRIENDGSGRIETVWPAGEHTLSVEISNPSGQDTGLWVGTVRIPSSGNAEVEPTAPPAPAPAAAPVAAAAASIPAEAPREEAASAPEMRPSEQVSEPEAEVAADADVEVEIEPDVETPQTDPAAEVEAGLESEVEIAEERPAAVGAPAAAAAIVAEDQTEIEIASIEVEPTPEAEEEVLSAPEPVDVQPDEVAVEPLRSGTPPPSSEDQVSSGTSAVEPPLTAFQPPPAEVVAVFESWEEADPSTRDLTVVAFRGREPATGLSASDFRLRVGGADVAVETVGDASKAPLQLGVAVDVAADSGANWRGSGGRLTSLVNRAGLGRGHVFFAADGRVGDWDQEPGRSSAASEGPPGNGLTSLIVDSLARFEGRRGRTFLVVVTDGRNDADKAAWKTATETAADAGVPVLVIVLWDETFGHRIRKNLKQIAEKSGGSLFLVQGSDQLDRAAERFGPIIDAGVALRFALPSTVALPASISVATGDKSVEVTAPKGIR